jgi:hypothetical protein
MVELEIQTIHAAACVLLRHFGCHGFGGDQKCSDQGRVLDRRANHLGWVDDPLGDQIAVLAGQTSLTSSLTGIGLLKETSR